MKKDKIISASDAVHLIKDSDTLAIGGFVGIGAAEELMVALEKSFLETGHPNNLTLVYAAGQGDAKTKGLNHFAHEGLVKRCIGGHWGLLPALGNMAGENKIEAYNLPIGVLAHLYRDIAAHRPGVISKVGLKTFIDPRLEGGKLNSKTTEEIVQVVELNGEEFLFYKAFPLNIAILRGTTSDSFGNISMEKEALTLESLSVAQAVKNAGGTVIAQVERIVPHHTAKPKEIKIPGSYVDYVVVASPENHMQTYIEPYNPALSGEEVMHLPGLKPLPLNERKIICRRATLFLKQGALINLGIGLPEGVALIANEEGILDTITMSVEPGGYGGVPAGGLNFGAVYNADAVVDMPYQFDFYDGGGLDQAFLGMAQADEKGNVNVSKFGKKVIGAGGFINITQNTREVYFLGTFNAKSEIAVEDNKLKIINDSPQQKFVANVGQVTFSGEVAVQNGHIVYYITERCVFKLTSRGLELIEIAPGIDLQKDILDQMGFRPVISENLTLMDPRLFSPEPMGFKED